MKPLSHAHPPTPTGWASRSRRPPFVDRHPPRVTHHGRRNNWLSANLSEERTTVAPGGSSRRGAAVPAGARSHARARPAARERCRYASSSPPSQATLPPPRRARPPALARRHGYHMVGTIARTIIIIILLEARKCVLLRSTTEHVQGERRRCVLSSWLLGWRQHVVLCVA